MKSGYRNNGCIRINGDGLKEVNLSSAQPTLLGLMVKNEYEYRIKKTISSFVFLLY